MAENIINYRLSRNHEGVLFGLIVSIYSRYETNVPGKYIHTRSARICMSTDTWRT